VPQDEEARMNVRYRVELSQAERSELTALLSGGKHAARKLKRAQILLAADAGGMSDILCIPRSRDDPKILGRDDAEVVGDRVAEVRPIARNLFAQETERRVGELRTSGVAFVVGNVSMHQAP